MKGLFPVVPGKLGEGVAVMTAAGIVDQHIQPAALVLDQPHEPGHRPRGAADRPLHSIPVRRGP
jgi:hypothetical protein